jgi:predicted RNase H-like HicB family nuclease
MTTRYPIVFETEESGAVSAYVPGLPLYAAADTAEQAEAGVRELLAVYVEDREARGLGLPQPQTEVKIARVTVARGCSAVAIVGPAALLGRYRSARKAAAARRGRRDGDSAGTRRAPYPRTLVCDSAIS